MQFKESNSQQPVEKMEVSYQENMNPNSHWDSYRFNNLTPVNSISEGFTSYQENEQFKREGILNKRSQIFIPKFARASTLIPHEQSYSDSFGVNASDYINYENQNNINYNEGNNFIPSNGAEFSPDEVEYQCQTAKLNKNSQAFFVKPSNFRSYLENGQNNYQNEDYSQNEDFIQDQDFVDSQEYYMNQNFIDNQHLIENQPLIENQNFIENQELFENQDSIEDQDFIQNQEFYENQDFIHNQNFVQNQYYPESKYQFQDRNSSNSDIEEQKDPQSGSTSKYEEVKMPKIENKSKWTDGIDQELGFLPFKLEHASDSISDNYYNKKDSFKRKFDNENNKKGGKYQKNNKGNKHYFNKQNDKLSKHSYRAAAKKLGYSITSEVVSFKVPPPPLMPFFGHIQNIKLGEKNQMQMQPFHN